jgi:hypothetical protein
MSAEKDFLEKSSECERRGREDFMKFVSDNEERVRMSLCQMGEFARESFCSRSDSTDFARSFMWKPPQAKHFGS